MERLAWARTRVVPAADARHAIPGRLVLAAVVLAVASALVIPWLSDARGLVLDDIDQDGTALLVALALAISGSASRGDRRFVQLGLALGIGAQGLGMSLNDLPAPLNEPLLPLTNLLYAAAALLTAGTTAVAVTRDLPRRTFVTATLDAVLLFLACVVLVVSYWADGSTLVTDRPLVRMAIVGILACVLALAMPLLARPVRLTLRGPLGVVLGILLIALAAVGWFLRIATIGTPTHAIPADMLFPAGVILVGFGGLAWDLSPHTTPRARRAAELLVDIFPLAAVLACVVVALWRPSADGGLTTAVLTLLVVVLATARQVMSRAGERSARRAEAAASLALADVLRERADTVRSLARLEAADTLEETARRIVEEAMRLDGIDMAVLSVLEPDGTVVAVASAGLDELDLVGRPLPGERAEHIRTMALTGPWIEEFGPVGEPHLAAVHALGIRATANAPLRWDTHLVGSLGLGTRCPDQASRLRDRLPTVREFGIVGSALVGPLLAQRERVRSAASEIEAIIAESAFHPVYQPVVALDTGAIVGFESLTRFADGTPPDVRFASAEAAGRGLQLEAACLAASLLGASSLPSGTWLSLNVSPELVSAPNLLGPVIAKAQRPLVLEITEHSPVADYGRLAASLRGLDGDVRLAVDDAGAGYAGLRHILEIRPHIVKLDVALVRSVDSDIARQALISSLISFAGRTDATVLAEGVETVREFEVLRGMGVTLGQGYLLGRPAPAGTWQRLAGDIDGDGVDGLARVRPVAGADPEAWRLLPFAS